MGKLRTHYDNLQVSETASQEVIRGAYKYLSQKWHPDRNPDNPEKAARVMKIINDAYEVLSDPQKRQQHDEWIRVQRQQGAASSAGNSDTYDSTDSSQSHDFEEAGGGSEYSAGSTTSTATLNCHPWRRYFARMIDILIASLSFGAATVFLDSPSGESPAFLEAAYENEFLLTILVFLFWMPIEAFFMSFWATTPGKWILGISVLKRTGDKLSFAEALKRSLGVWVQGLAFGIPFVSLFTVYNGYKRLTTTGTTLWDANVDSEVRHRPLSGSPVVYITVGLVITGGIAYVRSVSNESSTTVSSTTATPKPAPKPATPAPVTAASNDFGFYIENKCNHPIALLIRYQDTDGVWRIDGKWNVGGNASGYLNDDNGNKLTTNSAVWYYHAETTDGSDLEWRGEHPYTYNGRSYSMIRLEDKKGDSNWSTTCD